ncbi:hypothetical protein Sjap_023745 [Stephania japonica]|uniref:Uncharacterized protein n=1 Tax=Stephania japonica TaxID=461633 RepID=A0AAP0HJ88_9MAGN
MIATLKNLNGMGELSRQPIFLSEETLTSKTVMLDELLTIDEYWSEPQETLEISLHEPTLTLHRMKRMKPRKKLKSFQKGWRNHKKRARKTNLWCW